MRRVEVVAVDGGIERIRAGGRNVARRDRRREGDADLLVDPRQRRDVGDPDRGGLARVDVADADGEDVGPDLLQRVRGMAVADR